MDLRPKGFDARHCLGGWCSCCCKQGTDVARLLFNNSRAGGFWAQRSSRPAQPLLDKTAAVSALEQGTAQPAVAGGWLPSQEWCRGRALQDWRGAGGGGARLLVCLM